MKTLAMGEILFDRIEGKDYFGGAPVNVATHLSRLGAESYMLSALGNDQAGAEALRHLNQENIKLNYIQRDSTYPTGLVEVSLTDGIPSYHIVEGSAWDNISLPAGLDKKLISEVWDIVYCGTLAQRTQNNHRLFTNLLKTMTFSELFFDVNLRQNYFSKEVIAETMQLTTILKINDEELPIVSKLLFGQELNGNDLFAKLSKKGLKLLILTLGKDGSTLYHKDLSAEGQNIPCGEVTVVDTVGAGDSFSGTFLSFYMKGESIVQAAKKAAVMADYVVGKQGAVPLLNEEIKLRLGLVDL